MLRAHCPRHQRDVLVSTSQIEGVRHLEHVFLVDWHCTCGGRGTARIPRRGLTD
jgi:hypothetical protein